MVFHHKISDIDWLKCVLINRWTRISRDTLNWVIDQLLKRLMKVIKAKGAMLNFVWTNSVCI